MAKETSTMTKFRLGVVIVLLALAYSSPTPLYAEQADADSRSDFRGATYLITVIDAAGAFVSRVVITLHGDRTLSAIDSDQGGQHSSSLANLARGTKTARGAWLEGHWISTSRRTQMWRAWIIPSRSIPTAQRWRVPLH